MTITAAVLQETQSDFQARKLKEVFETLLKPWQVGMTAGTNCKGVENVHRDFFSLLKKPSIFIANVEWFGLPCYLNSPFFCICDTPSVKYWQKKSKRKAED